MKAYSTKWKSSSNPTKQRKYRAHAPLHAKRKFVAAPLVKALREKHKRKSAKVRVGDKVKVLRGSHKGKSGKIERVDLQKERIYITGLDIEKIDGSKSMIPVNPSNVIIEELNTEDKKRFKKTEIKK